MTAPGAASAPGTKPKSVVVVLLDSLNRHLLGAYDTPTRSEFDTPNLDRFAAQSVRFDRHFVGSLPCMPARHDLLCGAWDFLWKPWGSIELWEQPVTAHLRHAGIPTMLVSDHPHLFESGGENYHTDFYAWQYERGHEGDPWKTRADPTWMGAPEFFGKGDIGYERSRSWFKAEEDFPGPKTMAAAADWLEHHAPHHDRFFLWVDEFDPHEPFDTPESYARMYDPDWEGPHLYWPPYATQAKERGIITDRQGQQVRAQYGAKLTMIDHWFGKLLDAMERGGLWEDTALIVCTDHGHYLGERDQWGKPQSPIFNPLGHIPLLVRWPGVEAGSRDCLTSTVDIFATICDVFDVAPEHRTHGQSFAPVLTGQATTVREWSLAGIWGREVHLVTQDGTKYAKAPDGDNAPLSMWSNRWSTMPVHQFPNFRMPPPDDRAYLDRMPGSTVPVIRQPYQPGDMMPFWGMGPFRQGSQLFDVDDDPMETNNRIGSAEEKQARDLLADALRAVEAPAEQLERLGIA